MTTVVVNKNHGLTYDVLISRPSKWGNDYSHLENAAANYKVETREEAVAKYEEWIFTQRDLLASLKELKGKVLCCFCHPAPCHGHILARLADTTWWKDDKIILECSTKGDIRFSAFGAEVELFGKTATIEEHYQLAKRFVGGDGKVFTPKSIYDVKGKNNKIKDKELTWIVVGSCVFPPEFRVEFYKLMWLKYLDQNPELLAYASRFDDYNDIFKGKSLICQADCIRQYIKEGRHTMVKDVESFARLAEIEI